MSAFSNGWFWDVVSLRPSFACLSQFSLFRPQFQLILFFVVFSRFFVQWNFHTKYRKSKIWSWRSVRLFCSKIEPYQLRVFLHRFKIVHPHLLTLGVFTKIKSRRYSELIIVLCQLLLDSYCRFLQMQFDGCNCLMSSLRLLSLTANSWAQKRFC
jgi:hypothetical protein